jgi:hypothetical protein
MLRVLQQVVAAIVVIISESLLLHLIPLVQVTELGRRNSPESRVLVRVLVRVLGALLVTNAT